MVEPENMDRDKPIHIAMSPNDVDIVVTGITVRLRPDRVIIEQTQIEVAPPLSAYISGHESVLAALLGAVGAVALCPIVLLQRLLRF